MERDAVASFPPISATTNPYQRLLYAALDGHGIRLAPPARLRSAWLWRSRSTVRYLHFHWLSEYYSHRRRALAPVRLLLLVQRLALARLLGYRIVWTVHEIYPHDRDHPDWADRIAPQIFARASHALIVHDGSTRRKVISVLKREPVLIPAGTFAGVYRPGRPRAEVREALGVPESRPLILAFGLVRRYKHLEDVVGALAALPRATAPEFGVLVAGQVMDESVAETLTRAAETDDRLLLRLEFVPDESVAELFEAADALLITRHDDGTSGVLTLGLSLGIPIIAPDSPSYRTAAAGSSSHWYFDPGDPSSLAEALRATAEAASERSGGDRRPVPGIPAWPEVARGTAAVLRGERDCG